MTLRQDIWVEEIGAVGPHSRDPDLYQLDVLVSPARGAASTLTTLTFRTSEALKLLALMQANPPRRRAR